MPQPDRTPPPTPQAAAIRAAADLVGVNELARQLVVKPRTLHALMDGTRNVRPGHLRDTMQILVKHRQKVGETISAIRAVIDGKLG